MWLFGWELIDNVHTVEYVKQNLGELEHHNQMVDYCRHCLVGEEHVIYLKEASQDFALNRCNYCFLFAIASWRWIHDAKL